MKEKYVYKSYPQLFRAEVVAWLTEQGYSAAEAAKSLGIGALWLESRVGSSQR